jgi:hypothetical protein
MLFLRIFVESATGAASAKPWPPAEVLFRRGRQGVPGVTAFHTCLNQ